MPLAAYLLQQWGMFGGMINMPAVHEDSIDPSERLSVLENENDSLRRQLEAMKREIQSQSPTRSAKKSQPLRLMSDNSATSRGSLYEQLSDLSLKEKREIKTPGKKMRKFTARRWDFMDENEMEAYEKT